VHVEVGVEFEKTLFDEITVAMNQTGKEPLPELRVPREVPLGIRGVGEGGEQPHQAGESRTFGGIDANVGQYLAEPFLEFANHGVAG